MMQKLSLKQKFLGVLAIIWIGLLIQSCVTYCANLTNELNCLLVVGLILTCTNWSMTRSITQSLGGKPIYAVDIATRLANGDLDLQVAVDANDSSILLYPMKLMQQRLASSRNASVSPSKRFTAVSKKSTAGNKSDPRPRPKPYLKPVPSVASTKVAASDNDWETF